MSKKSYMLIGLVFCVLAAMLYYFIKDEPIIPKQDKQEAPQASANTLSYAGSTVVEEKDGKHVWEITAEKIDVDSKTQNVELTNIKGAFYKEDGQKVDLTARHGLVDNKTHDIELDGDIQAVASDGASFNAPKAKWVSATQHFFGFGGIIVKQQDTVITGDEMESDVGLKKVKVSGNAHIRRGGD